MRDLGRRVLGVTFTALVAIGPATAAPLQAQVCGDADGNGSVTVTDGVQVLRGAAGLPSTCASRPALCDVDGNGTISVTDGVSVLRLAAGLAVSGNCQPSAASAVQDVTDSLLPFLTVGLGALARGGTSSAESAAATTNCDFGGTATNQKMNTLRVFTLDACVEGNMALGHFQFGGTIQFDTASGALTLDLTVDTLASGRTAHFVGTLQAAVASSAGFSLNDALALMIPEGTVTVHFHDLALDGNGDLASGSAQVTDDANALAFASFTMTVTSTTQADVHVIDDDASTTDLVLDLATGALTPAT